MKKIITPLTVFLFLSFASQAFATDVPDFPSCVAPSGTVKVSYPSGIHGIVGHTQAVTGSDTVYQLPGGNYLQCFCSPVGEGIQTNWWKLSSLDQDQIAQLKNLGWIFVPSGADWGLEDFPYMAQNLNFSCLGGGQGGFSASSAGPAPVCDSAKPTAPQLVSVVRNGTTATLTWTASTPVTHYTIAYGLVPNTYIYGVPNTGNVTTFTIGSLNPGATYYFSIRAVNNCMPSDPSTNPPGQVLGASTDILAATGNSVFLYATAGAGIAFILLGLYLRRHEV